MFCVKQSNDFCGVLGEGKCESGFGRLKSKLECWRLAASFVLRSSCIWPALPASASYSTFDFFLSFHSSFLTSSAPHLYKTKSITVESLVQPCLGLVDRFIVFIYFFFLVTFVFIYLTSNFRQ